MFKTSAFTADISLMFQMIGYVITNNVNVEIEEGRKGVIHDTTLPIFSTFYTHIQKEYLFISFPLP